MSKKFSKETMSIKIVCAESQADAKLKKYILNDVYECKKCKNFYSCELAGGNCPCSFSEEIVRAGMNCGREFVGWSASVRNVFGTNRVLNIYSPANLIILRNTIEKVKQKYNAR